MNESRREREERERGVCVSVAGWGFCVCVCVLGNARWWLVDELRPPNYLATSISHYADLIVPRLRFSLVRTVLLCGQMQSNYLRLADAAVSLVFNLRGRKDPNPCVLLLTRVNFGMLNDFFFCWCGQS